MGLPVSPRCTHPPATPWRGMRKVGFTWSSEPGTARATADATAPDGPRADGMLFRCETCGAAYDAVLCSARVSPTHFNPERRGKLCEAVAEHGRLTCRSHANAVVVLRDLRRSPR